MRGCPRRGTRRRGEKFARLIECDHESVGKGDRGRPRRLRRVGAFLCGLRRGQRGDAFEFADRFIARDALIEAVQNISARPRNPEPLVASFRETPRGIEQRQRLAQSRRVRVAHEFTHRAPVRREQMIFQNAARLFRKRHPIDSREQLPQRRAQLFLVAIRGERRDPPLPRPAICGLERGESFENGEEQLPVVSAALAHQRFEPRQQRRVVHLRHVDAIRSDECPLRLSILTALLP